MRHLRCPKKDIYIAVSQSEISKIMGQGLFPESPLTYYRRQAMHDALVLYNDIVIIRVNTRDALSNGVQFYAGDEEDSFKVKYLSPTFMYIDSCIHGD